MPSGSHAAIAAYLKLLTYMDMQIDHRIKSKFKAKEDNNEAELETIQGLESCLEDVKVWMDENRLKMNSSKTEFILFGSRGQ